MPIRKDPETGIYWIDITMPGVPRIRRSTRTKDRQAAQELHDQVKAQLWRSVQLGEEPDHPFDEAALEMLKLSEGQSDYDTKVRHVAYWREKLGGSTPVRSLNTGAIMVALPTTTANPTHKTSRPASNATKNRYIATIRRILTLCEKWEWIDRCPRFDEFDEPAKRVRWEPPEVITKLIHALSLDWMRDVCLFAVATGMRETEILTLPPSQVNVAQRTAWVTAYGAKSGVARAVPLNDDALSVIEQRLPRARDLLFFRDRLVDDVPKLIDQIDDRCFKRACEDIGIQDFRFHDLRHTWASWHAQNGTPLLVLKELGGWETLDMVQRYAHLAPSHLAHHAATVRFWAGSPPKVKQPPDLTAVSA